MTTTPSTTECDACHLAATTPMTGMYRAGCKECTARMIASGTAYFEALNLRTMTPTYVDLLKAAFGDDWQHWHKRVRAWQEHAADLKAKA